MKITKIEISIFCIIVFLIFIIGFANVSQHSKFIEQCKIDKKEYECEVLYKQMHPDMQTIMVIH